MWLREHVTRGYGFFYEVTDVLHTTQTDWQALKVVQTAEQGRALLLDDVLQVWESNEYLYHELIAHPALTAHPDPKRVCVLGAGDGGTCREVLRHGVEHLDHAELDGGVVEACKVWMPSLSAGAFEDPRLHLHIGDGRAFVTSKEETYDAVIMDMTDPFGPSTMLYTREMFQGVKRSLRGPHGVFAMHAESPISRPTSHRQIIHTLSQVFKHVTTFYVYIHMYGLLWSVAVASDSDDALRTDAATLDARLAARGMTSTRLYNGQGHHALRWTPPWITELVQSAHEVPIITDAASVFIDEIDINRSEGSTQGRTP